MNKPKVLQNGRMLPALEAALAQQYELHSLWKETDPGARKNQQVHFTKNLSLIGGLLMATLDPEPHKKFIGRRAKDKATETIEHLRGSQARRC